VSKDGSSVSASDCGVCCANPETANINHKHAAGGKAIFMSDDERDAAVGQPLRLPNMAGAAPALQFVILSEVACQAVALCEALEESLVNGI
jgi:hypothetical protein